MPDTQTPAATEAAKKRRPRQSVYIFSCTIPIEAGDPDSLASAMAILAKVKEGLPDGSTTEARIGTVEAA